MVRVERRDADYNIYLTHAELAELTYRDLDNNFHSLFADIDAMPPLHSPQKLTIQGTVDRAALDHPDFAHDNIYFEMEGGADGPLVMLHPTVAYIIDTKGSFGTRYDGYEAKVTIFREDTSLQEGEITSIEE